MSSCDQPAMLVTARIIRCVQKQPLSTVCSPRHRSQACLLSRWYTCTSMLHSLQQTRFVRWPTYATVHVLHQVPSISAAWLLGMSRASLHNLVTYLPSRSVRLHLQVINRRRQNEIMCSCKHVQAGLVCLKLKVGRVMCLQVHLAQRLASAGDELPITCSWSARDVPSMPWLEYVPGRDTLIGADQLAAGLPLVR